MKTLGVLCVFSLALLGAEGPAKSGEAAAFEKRFLQMMTQHHEGGIEMAQACQQKASRAELKQFCSKMATAQGAERQQMMGWRKDWYRDLGGAQKSEMQKMVMQHKQHMAKLNTLVGDAFDQSFLDMMIQHHRQAVADSKACVAQAEHAELKQLCGKMQSDQEKEIGQMQGWLKK